MGPVHLSTCYLNKILLEHSCMHSLTYCLWPFLHMMAELNNWDRHYLKKSKIFTIWLFKENICQWFYFIFLNQRSSWPKRKKKKSLTRDLWIYQQIRFLETLWEHFSGKQMILSIKKKIKETGEHKCSHIHTVNLLLPHSQQ